ncbi:PREDICTED: uncharacterized protein LOC109174474 [Ipomoea nil]|uniref:uncharacterized protein LOC109174474 n=1 Tax=Ipomoea nil TaxID=35883 RepID=UPI0009017494|nr:PREDICTED: uncharacterized protein LOC109174474 [Ipomoea nil]
MAHVDSIEAWLWDMWTSLPIEMIEKIIIVCWAIWDNRNNMVFKDQSMDAKTLVTQALLYMQNWKQVHIESNGPYPQQGQYYALESWQPPMQGSMQINVDVAMDFERHRMGFGWVMRDGMGVVVNMGWHKIGSLYSVREADAVGVREALSWIKCKGWNRVIVETDAQIVTTAVKGGTHNSPFGLIIHDIRSLLNQLHSVTLYYILSKGTQTPLLMKLQNVHCLMKGWAG